MDEINNLSSEFSDEFLHTQADAGNRFPGQEFFEYGPTQEEMRRWYSKGYRYSSSIA
jgi:hypothetical protein